MPKIYLLDVTNRDGVQTARIGMSKFQKTMLHHYLGKIGVYQSEMGFPFLDHEEGYVRANLALRDKGAFGNLKLSGWCRAVKRDVEASLPLGVRDFNLSISTSDQMIVHKFQGKLDRKKILEEMRVSVKCALDGGATSVGVNAEDASRTDLEYLKEFGIAAREAGAHRIRYCDTIGHDSPVTIYRRIKEWGQAVGLPIELHCHNDLGMAVANSLSGARAANDAGVDAYINVTVNGIGERAGQADLLTTALALKYAASSDAYTLGDDLDLSIGYIMGAYVSYAFDIPIPMNQPGLGSNAFAHESGIHADGALKDHANYELYDLAEIGRDKEERQETGRVITTGEYGGMAGFKYVCGKLGITLPDGDEARLMSLAQYVNLHNQKPLKDDEIKFLCAHPEEVTKLVKFSPIWSPENAPALSPERASS